MRVLIADDDPTALLLLESALEEWGYEVVSARDGTEAWDILCRADAPSLAILDWMMPGLDGVEICRKVRHRSEPFYVYLILLTGKARNQDIVLGMDSGADDYVSKPFEEQELRVRLRAGRRIVELQDALRIQATHDSLTGVWNRRTIFEILRRESARVEREGTSLGVIMGDLDHFKMINDTFGHPAGDAVLCEASRRMGNALRPDDALGRYGGEEFLVVMPGSDLAGSMGIAERMRRAIEETPVAITAGTTPVTISLGAASGKGSNLDSDLLVRMADQALYRAKQRGRNRVETAVHSEDCATSYS